MRGPVARRYAHALFDLAFEKDTASNKKSLVDIIESELLEIRTILNNNIELQKVLYHPQIVAAEKKDLLDQLFKGKISEVTSNFLALLVDRRRENYLSDIVDEYVVLANESRGVVEAHVTSAVELKDEEKSELSSILARLTGKKVQTTYQVDPSIVGGVIVRIGDKIIDGSIKTRLTTLREQLKAIS
jgi:F-type H+-transporting ATPase subunit delta